MENKLELLIKSLDKNFATDIVAIDMALVSPIFDTFVIVTADNARLMNAIKENIADDLEKEGIFMRKSEGGKDSTWILLDYDEIIVHIFSKDERKNYALERLWGDQHRVEIDQWLGVKNEL